MQLRRATVPDLDPAARVLAAAFHDYPWTRHVIPQDEYPERLRELQLLYLRHAHRHGIVVLEASGGVAALLPPGTPDPDEEVLARIVALHGNRIDRLLSGADAPATTAPSAWTLETLGVRPEAQGRGIGSALLDHALEEAARAGAREIALETSDARNVRFYERHGFTVLDETIPPTAPPVWRMLRSGCPAYPAPDS
ncbi:GNAT family N-acetyltransferase [Brachybacterium hainanense]|uniref:GNAT family N-acetyltransferase n=1 Tax=Brachybacterium hainanense TaxID=1541174 RepID=A0ABV6RC04_9MICO